jgi:hypothetical protein
MTPHERGSTAFPRNNFVSIISEPDNLNCEKRCMMNNGMMYYGMIIFIQVGREIRFLAYIEQRRFPFPLCNER